MYVRAVIRDIRNALGDEVRNFTHVSPENSVRLRASLGTACAALTAVLLSDWMNLDNPWWAGITTLVVSRATYGATLVKGILRVIGTVAGAALSLVLVGLCIDNTFAMLCLIFFMSVGTVIASLYRGRDSYAWSMAGFIIVLISLAALNISGDVVFHFAVYRSMEISLGTVVGVVMSAIFNRARPTEAVVEALEEAWKNMAEALRVAAEGWGSGEWDEDRIRAIKHDIDRKTAALPGLIFESRMEGELKLEQVAAASRLNRLASQLARRMFPVLLGRPALRRGYAAHFTAELEETARCLDALSGSMKVVLQTAEGAHGVCNTSELLRKAVEALSERHMDLVRRHAQEGHSAEEMFAWGELRHVLGDFSKVLINFTGRDAPLPGDTAGKPVREDMVVRQAIGLGLTMVLIPVIWNWCDFPGMLQIGVTSIVLLQPDPIVGRRKGILRLMGCLTGGTLGLLLLGTPIGHYLGTWAMAYFAAIFLFSYLDRGDSRCSYIGLQAGIALTVTLVQGAGPGTTLEPPLTRFCGILGAFTIWNIVHALQGGFDPLSDLRKNLDEFAGFMGRLLQKGGAGKHAQTTAEALLRLKTAHRDLDVVIWEGSRTAEDNAFLQEVLVRADRVLMEAERSVREPKTAEARAVLSEPWVRLERKREHAAEIFASARRNGVSPLPELRRALISVEEDFEHDAGRVLDWAHESHPPGEAIMEAGEALMSLRSMFEAMDWIAQNEPGIRQIFADEFPNEAERVKGAAASVGPGA